MALQLYHRRKLLSGVRFRRLVQLLRLGRKMIYEQMDSRPLDYPLFATQS